MQVPGSPKRNGGEEEVGGQVVHTVGDLEEMAVATSPVLLRRPSGSVSVGESCKHFLWKKKKTNEKPFPNEKLPLY